MAITHIASAVPAGNPTTTFTITIPSTTLTDDILLLSVVSRDSTLDPVVVDNDTGGNLWALLLSHNNGVANATVWWKRATAATASKTVTVSSALG